MYTTGGQRGNQPPAQGSRQNLYPPIAGRPLQQGGNTLYPPVAQPVGPSRPSSTVPFPPSTPTGGGIRVVLKSEYRMSPAVQLAPNHTDIPRSTFQFDFGFERQVKADMEVGLAARRAHNFTHSNGTGPLQNPKPLQPAEDPVVRKYTGAGLNREAVVLALATYGDVQNKVLDFCASYGTLKEMGFLSENITGALAMHDNDLDKSLSQLTHM
eukprot:TRINITY_DN23142_c0_g1_i1.p1 TRINITY_DN23142_c0_g1~~TRINITY_DN23142_c0_g1_i1.p1  ORF type:complete len:212 (+),score=34.42 TRINITY_DN23142_c0_g1_i1:181-816(+)